jgi:hypothetical protein
LVLALEGPPDLRLGNHSRSIIDLVLSALGKTSLGAVREVIGWRSPAVVPAAQVTPLVMAARDIPGTGATSNFGPSSWTVDRRCFPMLFIDRTSGRTQALEGRPETVRVAAGRRSMFVDAVMRPATIWSRPGPPGSCVPAAATGRLPDLVIPAERPTSRTVNSGDAKHRRSAGNSGRCRRVPTDRRCIRCS